MPVEIFFPNKPSPRSRKKSVIPKQELLSARFSPMYFDPYRAVNLVRDRCVLSRILARRNQGATIASFVSEIRTGSADIRPLSRRDSPSGFNRINARDDVLILRFRDDLASRLSAESVNTRLKIIKQMFKAASRRFKIESPAIFVAGVRKDATRANQRRVFTAPELGRILQSVCGTEWEGMILVGLYTGQRLSDIAMLRWENVDVQRQEIALTTRKTNRRVMIPVGKSLLRYFLGIGSSDDPKTPVFPKAAAQLRRSKDEHVAALSNEFQEILANLGL